MLTLQSSVEEVLKAISLEGSRALYYITTLRIADESPFYSDQSAMMKAVDMDGAVVRYLDIMRSHHEPIIKAAISKDWRNIQYVSGPPAHLWPFISMAMKIEPRAVNYLSYYTRNDDYIGKRIDEQICGPSPPRIEHDARLVDCPCSPCRYEYQKKWEDFRARVMRPPLPPIEYCMTPFINFYPNRRPCDCPCGCGAR